MSSAMAISYTTHFLNTLSNCKGLSNHTNRRCHILNSKSGIAVPSARPRFSCSASMADGQSSDRGKLKFDHLIKKAKIYWDALPQPITSFPWSKVGNNFIQLIVDVAAMLIKYLMAPVLAVSAFSEMSYCAYEKRLLLVPVPLILGFAVAGILKEAASQSLPVTKDANVPWHLIAVAVFFTLLKLPGPYYPYWGRICIPHFANGGLLGVFWMLYSWYQSPEASSDAQKV
ncbi:hypothetical protein vseg_018117 [Gypsophila vaccaria]